MFSTLADVSYAASNFTKISDFWSVTPQRHNLLIKSSIMSGSACKKNAVYTRRDDDDTVTCRCMVFADYRHTLIKVQFTGNNDAEQ